MSISSQGFTSNLRVCSARWQSGLDESNFSHRAIMKALKNSLYYHSDWIRGGSLPLCHFVHDAIGGRSATTLRQDVQVAGSRTAHPRSCVRRANLVELFCRGLLLRIFSFPLLRQVNLEQSHQRTVSILICCALASFSAILLSVLQDTLFLCDRFLFEISQRHACRHSYLYH